MEGAPIGSTVSPVNVYIFVAEFEQKAIETSILQRKVWLRYVDDTFITWKYGRQELERFLTHLNNQHASIKFIMETEENNTLPFLDVLVKKRQHGKLGHTVYRRSTHIGRYLHAKTHHHPAQTNSVGKTLKQSPRHRGWRP